MTSSSVTGGSGEWRRMCRASPRHHTTPYSRGVIHSSLGDVIFSGAAEAAAVPFISCTMPGGGWCPCMAECNTADISFSLLAMHEFPSWCSAIIVPSMHSLYHHRSSPAPHLPFTSRPMQSVHPSVVALHI
ncbi:hypothetical protein E2C01_046035 [Portunus trituberculatus]|uniref:Uncharacterized protein n=1 Tax=Portunus trituberculatus TaxID=210409 RepID=A0A5B7G6I9_PORTR|nr:hypothetical protein [Portunus trituberculatus]